MARSLTLSLALSLTVLAASAASPPPNDAHPAKATLPAFADEAEFNALLARWREAARQRGVERRSAASSLALNAAPAAGMVAESSAKSAADNAAGSKAEGDSITNVQTAGVDEGGIVKRAGDHLVILRRGRLFTVRVGGDELRPVAAVDAYAPGTNPSGAWYDELLIHGRTVVVVGYSYARGGTEIGLFELGDDGSLAYRATHNLRSSDYYSSRNYASRLVGNRLVFYAPMPINPWQPEPQHFMPQWRRWMPQPGSWQGTQPSSPDWKPILPATRIFRTDDELDPFGGATLHTVTSCELGTASGRGATIGDMHCEAQAVLGPPGRVFYVSADNVYVWTTNQARRHPWGRPDDGAAMPRSSVVRLPLDGAAPSALKTTGAPIDQLSFLQDAGGHLNVLLRSNARGDGMWGAEASRGDFALMRVPLESFGNGRDAAPRGAYRPLPGLPGHTIHNRFVGDWLLYGAAGQSRVHAMRHADGSSADAQALELGHGVERIEALGAHALVVGSEGRMRIWSADGAGDGVARPRPHEGRDLHFTTLRLDRATAAIASHASYADAAQGESRTHGFFYRATGRDEGLLGLPIVGPDARGRRPGVHGVHGVSASVAFVRNRGLELKAIGTLDARSTNGAASGPASDGCKASCVDWYGNARPIFLGDRVFALLGYELVEGRVDGGTFRDEVIRERQRVDFGPRATMRWGRDE